MTNNSDYKKFRTNLFELLPDVYRSETNHAIFENLFNRFLTKQETDKVAGYIGKGNPEAIVKRQIHEPTVHRQGYQLQPILYNKIGSIEWMSSWYDLLNEAERLGVDKERMQEWLNLLKFNWVPPIDIDKLIHYRDYYWFDEENSSSSPQYITIRSRCATATAYVNFQQRLVNEFGATIPTIVASSIDETIPQFGIISITSITNQIIVTGDVTADLSNTQFFKVTGTVSNNNTYQVVGTPTYSISFDNTIIPVTPGSIVSDELSIGLVTPTKFDKLVVSGEYTKLLEPGFIFFYKNSTNAELDNSFFTVVESTYDSLNDRTIVKIDSTFTNSIVDGVISQEEILQLTEAARSCQCNGSVGWDILQWDDNPVSSPLWNEVYITSITNPGPPLAPGVDNELWWDQGANILYQYNTLTGWVDVWHNFSKIFESSVGVALWDSTVGCGISSIITSADQWITQNKWVHKSDITNFSNVKQATLPIIEYDWDLELNEWTYTTYNWQYRESNYSTWASTDTKPDLIELISLDNWIKVGDEIVLSEEYGDLTSYFVPGKVFNTNALQHLEVLYSQYVSPAAGQLRQTRITITPSTSGLIPVDGTPIRPLKTSQGDGWNGYNVHWLYVGQNDTVPVVHQPYNEFTIIPPGNVVTVHISNEYEYTTTHYSQEVNILVGTGVTDIELTTLMLRQRALIGTNDIRVYVNDIRQYGNYDEIDNDLIGYVTDISFLPGHELTKLDSVRIEVGEASPLDFGFSSIPVRTIADNTEYQTAVTNLTQPVIVSLIEYRKEEQVKTDRNQYPLFDIYNVDGTPAYLANQIFGFKIDPTANVNLMVGMRLATDVDSTDYVFEQFIVDEITGTMYAFRDYANQIDRTWVNPITREVSFWDGFAWSANTVVGNHYMSAIVSDTVPGAPWDTTDGVYWYDTNSNQLKRQTGLPTCDGTTWEVVDTYFANDDQTLQSIWRKGLNDELYIPEKRDWDNRSLAEYNDQKDLFVTETSEELFNSGLSLTEALVQAEEQWYTKQSNHLSLNGDWIGDWEIPDPLYYNVSHENRPTVSFRELLTHFNTIVQAQPKLPGFNGPREHMFHLIPTNDVNYGLGGKIKEYNYGFDTFLSTLFTNTVSFRTLLNFAHDQYDSLLNNINELFRKHSTDLFLDTSTTSLTDQSAFVAQSIIDMYEQNDVTALLYGDSTTFTEVDGVNDLGIRNWIATLPYLNVVRRQLPVEVTDENNINQIIHHDGHRADYRLDSTFIDSVARLIVSTPDERTHSPGPTDPAIDTFGRTSSSFPPNDTTEFDTQFNTTIVNREGVYWYRVSGSTQTLYRLTVADIGIVEPSISLPEGTLWLDLTPSQEVLRVRKTDPYTNVSDWAIVDGLSTGASPLRLHNGTNPSDINTAAVSAWQIVDLSSILRSTVIEIENRLYENAPTPYTLSYDFVELAATYPQLHQQLLEESFLAYTNESEIIAPYVNDTYSSVDAFTWNYRYSSPGQSFQITNADSATNSFTVEGDVTSYFIPTKHFHIKNSSVNDGYWETISSIFTGIYTTIYVVEQIVNDSSLGVIYTGALPSPYGSTLPYNWNIGGESGGDWRDLYQKLYKTPYPHLEPWALQGYVSKPTWWDEEYLNDDIQKWGDRRWKYKHGFEIVAAAAVADYFEIEGDFRELFFSGRPFNIIESPAVHDGSWIVGALTPVISATTGLPGTATVSLTGNQTALFSTDFKFAITDYPSNNLIALLTTASSSFILALNKTVVVVKESVTSVVGFDNISGTVYDPTTNLSTIYVDITSSPAFDVTSNITQGRIDLVYGMWENIRIGQIPAGREYPNGEVSITGKPHIDYPSIFGCPLPYDLPSFGYFSVNIGNSLVTTGGTFNPDDVFPPYWDYATHFGTNIIASIDNPIRSVYSVFGEIVSPGTSYVFGDAGPVEWEWRNSSQFLYDQMSIAYQLDPVRFTFSTFGTEVYNIAGLLIDKRTNQVQSHNNTVFHGDIVSNSQVKFDGTNQWYMNFARYIGLDASMSDFRSQWTLWTAPLTYQFASFIDTPSLDVDHRYVCLGNFDYRVTAKRSPGVEDFWLDSFQTVILNMPPKIARYDNEYDWEVELRTKSPIGKSINYYDVHNYQFNVDTTTDICSIYTWDVVGVSVFNNTFGIKGDQTPLFSVGRTLNIINSTGNDGTYTISSAAYNVITNQTIITVAEDIVDFQVDGLLSVNYRALPWVTGDIVVLSTRESLPIPLEGDNINGVKEYFIIVVDAQRFKLARTKNDAILGNYIDITTSGVGDQFVGQIDVVFSTEKTPNNWRHYAVDKGTLLEFTPPYDVKGIQTIINIVDGYEVYTREQGWVFNSDSSLRDFDDGSKMVGWQYECKRFIDYVFTLRDIRQQVPQKYEATIDVTTDIWSFVGNSGSQFITGDPITVYVSGNLYPSPLARGLRYYMIRDALSTFRLAATPADANAGIPIDITSISGVDKIYIAAGSNLLKDRPLFEINPFRNGIWFRPTQGIVSNMLTGPVVDAFNSQLLLDQYSRALNRDDIQVYRQDKETSIRIADNIPNDVRLTSVFPDPYDYIHLATVHLFVDTYEHVLIFNNDTTEGQLLYDPFVGLNVTKFEMLFNRQSEFTQRPSVGGQYLSTFYNQGADLKRNFEASVDDMRLLYDTYQTSESNPLVEFSRKSIGYEGRKSYLDSLNINDKSQFAFWRGQIQTKGSLNSVKAFINSRRFIDAKVDEYWAVKIAEFGSAAEKEFVSMWVSTADTRSNDSHFQFILPGDSVDVGFTPIALSDTNRWFDQPDQLKTLEDNGGTLYFELKPDSSFPITIGDEPTSPNDGDGWVEITGSPTSQAILHRWSASTIVSESPLVFGDWETQTHGTWDPITGPAYLRHNTNSDFLTITLDLYPAGYLWNSGTVIGTGSPLTATELTIDPYIPSADSIRVFKDGVLLSSAEYQEFTDGQVFSTKILFTDDVVGSIINVVYKTSSLLEGLHFERTTSNIVKMNYPELVSLPISNLKIWGWSIDKESQNPAKVIDKKSETVISPVQVWDPARNFHYYNGIHTVDLQQDSDPAIYNNTPRVDQTPDPLYNFNLVYNNPTNSMEVGKTWLDTSNIDYVPYYDTGIFSNSSDRSILWGKLADWSEVKIYTWVESDIPPQDWDITAITEEGDLSIVESVRKSGRVKQSLFEKDSLDNWVILENKFDDFDALIEGTGAGTNVFTLSSITPHVVNIISTDNTDNTIIIEGDYSRRIVEGVSLDVFGTAGSPSNDGTYVVSLVELDGTNTKITVPSILITAGAGGSIRVYEPINIYVNGQLTEENAFVDPTTGNITVPDLDETAQVRAMVLVPIDETFITAEIESGMLLRSTEYTTDTYYDALGVEQTTYYFWIRDKTTHVNRNLSPKEAQEALVQIPVPYVFFQGVNNVLKTTFGTTPVTLPIRFTQAVVRGLRGIINDDFRYVLRWTRDFTLRDSLDTGLTSLQKKNLHEQWMLIRQEQPSHIPRWLWDKVTESIVGFKLTDSTIRVPSYERELYDTENGTDTQYGLRDDQASTNGPLALSTILTDLNNPNNDFRPVDINVFFQNYSFNSTDEIIKSMNAIYNTFPYTHVNRMFFEVLLDGLSLASKYEDMFKTSMVALHGVRPFEIGGLFDD